MSGGHWDYQIYRTQEHLDQVSGDQEVIRRFPVLAKTIRFLSNWLYETEHALDWDLSADSEIDDDRAFEKKAVKELFNKSVEMFIKANEVNDEVNDE